MLCEKIKRYHEIVLKKYEISYVVRDSYFLIYMHMREDFNRDFNVSYERYIRRRSKYGNLISFQKHYLLRFFFFFRFSSILKYLAIDYGTKNVKVSYRCKGKVSQEIQCRQRVEFHRGQCFSQCNTIIETTSGSPCCKTPLNVKSSLTGSLGRLKSAKSSPVVLRVSVRRCFAR